MTPKPFTLEVPEADIEDLKTRLTRTRFPDQAPDAPWAYGTDLGYMRASAAIRLASTAKAAPSTNPSAMQRSTTVSNSLRSRSQSRKPPCLFLEKVEWSGPSPSSPSRQNQR